MGVNVVDENKGSMTCEKYHSASSTSLSASRLIGVPMKPWKSRSKSQSRLAVASKCQWVPEGSCIWRSNDGHMVKLRDTPILQISEMERQGLQRIALAKLQELNLGCPLEVPKSETISSHQAKKRTMLLRKKAVTTNLFESKEKEKRSDSIGPVFGVPLSQCIAHDRLTRRLGSVSSIGGYHEQRDHCEEVLSALRISSCNLLDPNMYREGSPTDTSYSSSEHTSRSSITDCQSAELLVPSVAQICIKFLELKGLNTLGIFRVSGSQKRVRQLREDLDHNRITFFDDNTQPHDVAQLLKEYFRDLPEPLLPRALYRAFISVQRIMEREKKLKATRWLLYLLPVAHRDTLIMLLSFLNEVCQCSEGSRDLDGSWVAGNKMDISNIATVFGPNLLRMSKGSTGSPYVVHSFERAQERSDVILTIRSLIENENQLLCAAAEDLDSLYQQLMVDDPELLNVLLTRRMNATETEDDTEYNRNGSHPVENASPQDLHGITERDSTYISHEMESDLTDYIKSKIRPLMFSKETERSLGLTTTTRPHSKERDIFRAERRSSGSRNSDKSGSPHPPYTVTAAFTIKMEGKGQSSITPLERDQTPPARPRRVQYGRLRHKTSPAYITEETITTITIPPPRTGHKETVYKPLVCEELSSVNKGSRSSQYTKHSDERQGRGRSKPIEHATHIIPATHERWKRQEIIASEHIQL